MLSGIGDSGYWLVVTAVTSMDFEYLSLSFGEDKYKRGLRFWENISPLFMYLSYLLSPGSISISHSVLWIVEIFCSLERFGKFDNK